MADKFVLAVPKPEIPLTGVVRIRPKCHARLIALKNRTGMSVGMIVEQCVDFALDRLELREEEAEVYAP